MPTLDKKPCFFIRKERKNDKKNTATEKLLHSQIVDWRVNKELKLINLEKEMVYWFMPWNTRKPSLD